jgi:hypothetical protein
VPSDDREPLKCLFQRRSIGESGERGRGNAASGIN